MSESQRQPGEAVSAQSPVLNRSQSPALSLFFFNLKNLPEMQKTQVQSLGREDPLAKGMATTPVFLPGQSHAPRRLVAYSSLWDCKELDMTE